MAVSSFSGGKALDARLLELARKVDRSAEVRVGFLEGATYPDGTSVAMVAAIQEFGAPGVGIPPRPFFRRMITAKSPAWGDAVAKLVEVHDYDAVKVLGSMGQGIEGQLRQSIVDLHDPALAQSTIDRKGSDKPLIETGHMLQSIASEVNVK